MSRSPKENCVPNSPAMTMEANKSRARPEILDRGAHQDEAEIKVTVGDPCLGER